MFVDLKKAYDSVPQLKLWEALEKTYMNITLIKAVEKLYESDAFKMIKIAKELKQGYYLSPTLFKIYLEQFGRRRVKKSKGTCK